jgi:D-tyrosyl-tRNA(Tyr) deacylase
MSKAIYYFCAESAIDPVANNVFQCLTTLIPTTETNLEIDGYKVLEYIDEKGHTFSFVRLKDLFCHDYRKYVPIMDAHFPDYDFAGLINWHEGANAPEKVLTVHSTGDVPTGVFGATNPLLFKNLLVAINRNRIKSGLEDFMVSTEATHWSGVTTKSNTVWITDYKTPIYDVEIGSIPGSWENEIAVKVLASSLCEVFNNAVEGCETTYNLLCVGGVHFEESFSGAILDENHPIAIAHILPNQWLVSGRYDIEDPDYETPLYGIDKMTNAVNSASDGISAIVFHEGLKSIYKAICKTLAQNLGVPCFKHKTLRDLDRTMGILSGKIKVE